jgi:hypothetical protein
MSVRDMKMAIERYGDPFPLPSTLLFEGAGIDVDALGERYKSELLSAKAAPARTWYPITSSLMETEADLRYRVELWHSIPALALEGTIEEAYRKTLKPFQAQVRNVTFRAAHGPDGRWDTGDFRSVERYGPTNRHTWKRHGHEILGFEYVDKIRGKRAMHPTLASALDNIAQFDAGGNRLCGILLPSAITLVDDEVMAKLRATAPVDHGIESPAGSAL